MSEDNQKKPYLLSSTQIIALGFLFVILAGAVLLYLPVSLAEGKDIRFLDALFMSATSVCVTGLTTVVPAVHFSLFGKIVILILIQLGGLGVVTCATVFFMIIGKRITLKERKLIQQSYNMETLTGLVKMIKRIVRGTLLIEAIGACFYAFVFIPEKGFLLGSALAVFHSVSTFCNAGIDMLGDNSFQNYCLNPVINITTMVLVVTGGLGFVVCWDMIHTWKELHRDKLQNKKWFHKLQLHTKVVLVSTILLILGGALIIFLLEYGNRDSLGELNLPQKIMASFFQSVTTRTAGFFTVPQFRFRDESALVIIVLMFIGGSPGGTAGGMKTTTVAMLLLTVWAVMRGRRDTEVFGRKISSDNIRTGIAVFAIGIMVLLTAVIALCITEDFPLLDIIFEAASAIGTVGLSRGITADLSAIGKLIIIITMYIGRIGPFTMATAFIIIRGRKNYHSELPEKRILVG